MFRKSARNLAGSKQIRNVAGRLGENLRKNATAPAATRIANVQHRITLPRDIENASAKFGVAESEKTNNTSIETGLGSWVWDKQGERYLDMTVGSTLVAGHSHPKIVGAVRDQLVAQLAFENAQLVSGGDTSGDHPFVAKMAQYAPSVGDAAVFAGTGEEAVARAVQAARLHTGRQNVIVVQRGGGSSSTASSSRAKNTLVADMTAESFDAVLSAVETAAVVVDPLQFRAGLYSVPVPLLQHIRERCDQHGILLIFDETQSGGGRCTDGKSFWGYQRQQSAQPDLLVFGNSVASGMQVAGVCGKTHLLENCRRAAGGNRTGLSVSLAAGNATLDLIEEEELLQNAATMGELLAKEVALLPSVSSVRHRGTSVAADVEVPIGELVRGAAINHNLILRGVVGSNSLHITPAFNITPSEVEICAEKLYATFKGL